MSIMRCKYYERNLKECKCSDYYWSHSKSRSIVRCRLPEWKQKKGICPYDKTIVSKPENIKKDIKDKKQKLLEFI
jgi:hypothetical protein